MNKHKLDGMFREGLGSHKVTPRPEAWTKLKGNLDNGRKKGLSVYWRVAAVIVIFLTSVLLIYNIKESDRQVNVADRLEEIEPMVAGKANSSQPKQNDIATNQADILTDQAQNNEAIAEHIGKQPEAQALALEKTSQPTLQKKVSEASTLQADKTTTAISHTLAKADEDEFIKGKNVVPLETVKPGNLKELPHQEVDPPLTVALAKQDVNDEISNRANLPNVTITFKKDTNHALAEATSDNKEVNKSRKFALRKVINLAKDIKEGEVGISTLRRKKDELLAFNFNKKKNLKNSK